MERTGDVLGLESPPIEGLDQLEFVAAVELRHEFIAAYRPDGLLP